jgi:hypothetical protein
MPGLLAERLVLTHVEAMVVFAFFTSLVFAFLTKPTAVERVKYFLWSFFLFLAVGVGLGWLMYPFPR